MPKSFIEFKKEWTQGLLLGVAVLLLSASGGKPTPPWEEENVSFPMLNMEIRHQLEEHERQESLSEENATTLALESSNSSLWKAYESSAKEASSRLGQLNFLFQSLPTAHLLSEKAQKIAENKQKLFLTLQGAPYALAAVLGEEIDWTEELEMVLRYIAALLASYGTVNQMEPIDRKMLLDFALEEVEALERRSREILFRAQQFKEKFELKKATLSYYVNRDKQLVKSLLSSIKK